LSELPKLADKSANFKVGETERECDFEQAASSGCPELIESVSEALINVQSFLEGVQQRPFFLWTQMAGKSIRPLLSEVTGLSLARIAQGNLDKLRPSTAARVQASAEAWGRNLAMRNGWTDDDFNKFIANAPRTKSGDVGMWANWVFGLQHPETLPLPLTISHALEIDELIGDLSNAFETKDLKAFTGAVLTKAESEANKRKDQSPDEVAAETSMRCAWSAAHSWDAVASILPTLDEDLFLDHFAALDAEWGSRYFQSMKPEPVFLWLAPRLNEQLDLTSGEKKFRNLIYRPVRRLLELSYALAHYCYRKQWPAAPAGRGELGEALGLSDADVGNYFDGTRNLTMQAYQSYWQALCRHFGPSLGRPEETPMCPTPLGFIAIAWQHLLIQTTDKYRFKSAILLDKDDYRRRWKDHRRHWVDQLPSGDVSWPDWLLNQSV
jgi:hypothetical protein